MNGDETRALKHIMMTMTSLYAGNDEKSYDEWYAEQYLDFYGDYDREKDQNENALQP